jgi:putative transposase
MVQRAYRYRFYPTEEQVLHLAKTFGCCRHVYNYFLDLKQKAWEKEKKTLTATDRSALLTKLKEAHAWLKEVSSVCLQQAIRHLDTAFKNFFAKRARFPKFKKKHSYQSTSFTKNAFTYRAGIITLAKHKDPLNIKWSRRFEGDPTSLTISKDGAGRYFVSILVNESIQPLPFVKKEIGIDLGLTNILCDHEGNKKDPALFLKSSLRMLRRRQQRLSRKRKGSKNWQKAKKAIGSLCAKIRDKREDCLHKISKQLVNENQVIVAEDLDVKKMMKNRRLAQRIGDSGWGQLLRFLEYKCQWYGREFVQINRFVPSSKKCSHCSRINENLTLKDRIWECPSCRQCHDRDTNAAKNILAEGLKSLASTVGLTGIEACGASVRPT